MIILLGCILGLLLALFLPIHIPPAYTKYIAIGILAALDSIVGGISASLRKAFDLRIFLSGLLANSLLAMGLTWIGERLGVDISLAAIVAFGVRLFHNFAVIRRYLLHKWSHRGKIVEREN
jgi:small basic protein